MLFTTIPDRQSTIDPYHHISNNRVQLVDHILPWNDREVIDYGDEMAPDVVCGGLEPLELGFSGHF